MFNQKGAKAPFWGFYLPWKIVLSRRCKIPAPPPIPSGQRAGLPKFYALNFAGAVFVFRLIAQTFHSLLPKL